jgi:uncharacterized protein
VVELEALVDAAKIGDLTRIQTLLAEHPGLAVRRLPTGESPLMAALYRGHDAVVNALVELGVEVDVFAAAATGRLRELTTSLAQPDAVNAYSYDGWTPLHLAAFFGQLDAVRVLLAAGADVHAVSRNSLENTPLHAATAGRHSDVALALFEAGADPQVPDAGGYSATTIASENSLVAVTTAFGVSRR